MPRTPLLRHRPLCSQRTHREQCSVFAEHASLRALLRPASLLGTAVSAPTDGLLADAGDLVGTLPPVEPVLPLVPVSPAFGHALPASVHVAGLPRRSSAAPLE